MDEKPGTVEPPSNKQILRWYPRLFRTALRMTGNAADAADLTQEAFYRALKNWGSFDGGALPTTWLHQILINSVRDWARRRSRQVHEPFRALSAVAAKGSNGEPAEQLERRERLARLREAIEELPEVLRPAFAVTVLDGHTYEQAAELLSVPTGTIASRVHEARKLLRAAMRESFPEK